MAQKNAAPVELSELYHRAWDACTELWPLFLIRIGFLFVNFFLIALCLFIGFWPLVQALMAHAGELSGGNARAFFQSFDWMSYFTDWGSLGLMALVVALYVTAVSFFLAFFDGALYSQMNRFQKNGEGFSIKIFFADGLRYTLPMMGLQVAWILVFLVLLLGIFLTGMLGALIFNFLPWWIGTLLAVPAGVVGFLVFMGLMTAGLLAGAYLVDGHGIWESVGGSIGQVWRDKGHTLWAILLIIAVTCVFYVAFNVVFTGLSFIPFFGFLFILVKVAVNSVLTIGFSIYAASLAVTLQLEAKAAR